MPDDSEPFIRENHEERSLHFSEHEIQSRMSRLQPDALNLEYTRMMMGFLLFHPQPERIVMIGLGGGSLPKFCFRYLPRSRIEVVEIDAAVIALRESFLVPPDDERFAVIEGDGAEYVRAAPFPAQVLLVDGFDREGMPEQLCSAGFYGDCHAMLAEDGIMVVNLHLNHPRQGEYVDRIRECFGSSVFEVVDDDMTNSIVFASKGDQRDRLPPDAGRRPEGLAKDAWRQLMPTFKVIGATLTKR